MYLYIAATTPDPVGRDPRHKRTPICLLFASTLNTIEYSSVVLLDFTLTLLPNQLSEKFYFIVFSLPFSPSLNLDFTPYSY